MKEYTVWRQWLAWVGLISVPMWIFIAVKFVYWIIWAQNIITNAHLQ